MIKVLQAFKDGAATALGCLGTADAFPRGGGFGLLVERLFVRHRCLFRCKIRCCRGRKTFPPDLRLERRRRDFLGGWL